jgi:hypothetical protein
MAPTDPTTGFREPEITVNGRALSFAESMTVRVALGSFRIGLSDAAMRQGIGEPLATNYDTHAARVEQLMLQAGVGHDMSLRDDESVFDRAHRLEEFVRRAQAAQAGRDELPTEDDRACLAAIHATVDDRARARLIRDYWHDGRRADRTPRAWAYLHLGLLSGIIDRLLDAKA